MKKAIKYPMREVKYAPDADLLRRLRSAEGAERSKAWIDLLSLLTFSEPALRRWARRQLAKWGQRDESALEDVFQEFRMRLTVKGAAARFEPQRASWGSYTFGVFQKTFLEARRVAAKEPTDALPMELPDERNDPAEAAELSDLNTEIRRLIRRLPLKQRGAVQQWLDGVAGGRVHHTNCCRAIRRLRERLIERGLIP